MRPGTRSRLANGSESNSVPKLLEAIVVVFLLAETGIAISDRRSLTAVF